MSNREKKKSKNICTEEGKNSVTLPSLPSVITKFQGRPLWPAISPLGDHKSDFLSISNLIVQCAKGLLLSQLHQEQRGNEHHNL